MSSRRSEFLVGVAAFVAAAVALLAAWLFLLPPAPGPVAPAVVHIPRDDEPVPAGPSVAPAPRRVPRIDPVAAAKVRDVLAQLFDARRKEDDRLRRSLVREQQHLRDLRLAVESLGPDRDDQRQGLEARIRSIEVWIARDEAALREREDGQPGPDTAVTADLQARFEALGPEVKTALFRHFRDPDPRVATAAVAAHDHLRREQLWKRYVAVVGDDHGPAREFFSQIVDETAAADRLEAVLDGDADPAAVFTRWRDDLNARRQASAGEIAAWLLLGALPGAKAPASTDLPFLDPAINPQLVNATAGRPFQQLLAKCAESQKGDPALAKAVAALRSARK
jgi:hypothetical protein